MLARLISALLAIGLLVGPLGASAQPLARQAVVTPQPGLQASAPVGLPIGKSQLFRVNQAISKIVVGNPAIADAVPLSAQAFYIFGKKTGSTNVAVYSSSAQLLAVVDIIVGADVEAIKKALYDVMPNERIGVRAVNDSIAISGSVDSPAKVTRAMEVAKRFVDKDQVVVNDMRVTSSQQVMLEVKVAEIQRSLTKSLGFKPFLSVGNPGKSNFTLSTLDPVNLSNFAVATGTIIGGNTIFRETIDALEEKGVAKILAEPNLVAMSGDTASFLAGGEFPIPVATTSGVVAGVPTVTIEFKQFGISLAFTPTVVDADLINLVVAPEVSQLDKENSVTLNGFVIPGISTRRAKTTVELRDGQSFAIAGLISSDFIDNMRGLPGIMDIPVLGTLFHSSDYQRKETELVIIVTPKLVHPAPADTLVAPTDSFVPPSDVNFFLLAQPENPDSGLAPPNGGGLLGKYGHIIR